MPARSSRLETARTWAVDAGVLREVDEGRHIYDVLDRPLTLGESHNAAGIDPNAAPARSTTFDYLGLTNGIVQEAVSGQSATTGAKDYRYDAFGARTTLNAAGNVTHETAKQAEQTTTRDYTYCGQSSADGTVIARGNQQGNQLTTFVETPLGSTPQRRPAGRRNG